MVSWWNGCSAVEHLPVLQKALSFKPSTCLETCSDTIMRKQSGRQVCTAFDGAEAEEQLDSKVPSSQECFKTTGV